MYFRPPQPRPLGFVSGFSFWGVDLFSSIKNFINAIMHRLVLPRKFALISMPPPIGSGRVLSAPSRHRMRNVVAEFRIFRGLLAVKPIGGRTCSGISAKNPKFFAHFSFHQSSGTLRLFYSFLSTVVSSFHVLFFVVSAFFSYTFRVKIHTRVFSCHIDNNIYRQQHTSTTTTSTTTFFALCCARVMISMLYS